MITLPVLCTLNSPNLKPSNCPLPSGDTPKSHRRAHQADPGFVLPIHFLVSISYSLKTFHFSHLAVVSPFFTFSLKGKPSCFTHPGSPCVPVVAVPVVTTLISSFLLTLQFLSRALPGKQVYTNLPKPDKMNVQLFLFLAAYFSLHQNCSYTLPW